MRLFSVFATLLATPAMAHEAGIAHAHAEWAVPLGVSLIVIAGISAARAKVRK